MNKNMKKIQIIVSVIVLAVIIGLAYFFYSGSQQQVSKLDATDTTINFYDQWLKAVKEPTTADPSLSTLANSPILSKSLRASLTSLQTNPTKTPDPVLCQTVVPTGVSMRNIYVDDNETQILVTSRDKKVTEQAVVELKKYKEGWYINSIQCSAGEFAPEREFSFEKEGYLLKASVPKPFDPKNWHLIFEDKGEAGHVVPLFFNSESQCTQLDGTKSVCGPEKFTEVTRVSVHAQMTESGASVKKLEFLK